MELNQANKNTEQQIGEIKELINSFHNIKVQNSFLKNKERIVITKSTQTTLGIVKALYEVKK